MDGLCFHTVDDCSGSRLECIYVAMPVIPWALGQLWSSTRCVVVGSERLGAIGICEAIHTYRSGQTIAVQSDINITSKYASICCQEGHKEVV